MPYYEYKCLACGKPVRLFMTFSEYDKEQPACPHCDSVDLQRLISRVAVAKSEDARMDSLMDDSALAGLDEEDPKALGRFMRKMSNEMGEDMGDEFEEVVDRLEKGESPESIEESMPDLGAGMDDPAF
jgi:putative FmdB family regulatory protein